MAILPDLPPEPGLGASGGTAAAEAVEAVLAASEGRVALPPGVCTRFVFAKCRKGARCSFSHDVDREPYIAAVTAAKVLPPPSRSNASSAKADVADAEVADVGSINEASNGAEKPKAWRSVDWLLRGESVKKCAYLRDFAAAPWLSQVLDSPACASLLNVRGKSLRKEITEAFGALNAAHRALEKLGREGQDDAASMATQRPAVVVDLCCGKGFASLLMALSMPNSLVIAVDSNPHMELGHFRGQPNLAFRQLDVTSPSAGEKIAAAAAEEAERLGWKEDAGALPVVVVGVHLCGPLSGHAARIFQETAAPAALALAPCCLDKGRPEVKRRAKKLCVDPHGLWCQELLFGLPAACRRELLVDEDVLSARNTFILAARPQ